MSAPRKRVAPRPPIKAVPPPDPEPVDQSDHFRAWAVSQAVTALVGGDLPYEPDTYPYYPDRNKALQILIRSVDLCAKVTDSTPNPGHVAKRMAQSWAKLGVVVPAPFAQYVAYRLEAKS